MNRALPLHLAALGVALAIAGADAALHPPAPLLPQPAPRCSYERLRLVGAPLPANHPRYGPDVERWDGYLTTPPGAKAPIPVTCWLRDGRLVELASLGTEPLSDEDAADALAQEAPRLGVLPPETSIDLDWIWAELGLLESLDATAQLHFVTALVPSERFDRPWAGETPSLVPALLVRVSRHWTHHGVSHYSLFDARGRRREPLISTGYRTASPRVLGSTGNSGAR